MAKQLLEVGLEVFPCSAGVGGITFDPSRPQITSASNHVGHTKYYIGHKRCPYRPQTMSAKHVSTTGFKQAT